MSDELRCRVCGRPCYWHGITDHVGRRTSEIELRHYEQPDDGHAAVWQYDEIDEHDS